MRRQALMVIDLQQGIHTTKQPLIHLETVLNQVNQRITHYRLKKQPIIFIRHTDEYLVPQSQEWALFDILDTREEDFYIQKTHANSFYQTNLDALLKKEKITALEICGAQTEYCVDTTIRMAHGLGYTCKMKKGLTTTCSNSHLNAQAILTHHEAIWENRFLTFF